MNGYWLKGNWVKGALLAVLACLLVVAVNWAVQLGPLGQRQIGERQVGGIGGFERVPLLSGVPALFDVGVVDVNADGRLDVYTSNHSEQQFLLMGQGDGHFGEDQFSTLGLSQDPDFPGLEPAVAPVMSEPGMYVYWQGRRIVIECKGLDGSVPFSGEISVSAPMRVQATAGVEAVVTPVELPSGAEGSVTRFDVTAADGRAVFGPYNQSLPVKITLSDGLPLSQVYVGRETVHPKAASFTMYLRDRHGMAWSDYDSEGLLDVFVVRGGLRARMETLPERYSDELLISGAGTPYENQVDAAGIEKNACPALQTAWVDYDGDDLLDIYTVCFTPKTATRNYAKRQYTWFRRQTDADWPRINEPIESDNIALDTYFASLLLD